jgi:hypothetical protein
MPDKGAMKAESCQIVRDALATLDTDVQQIIRWHFQHDLPRAEVVRRIGQAQGVCPQVARRQFERALVVVRRALGNALGEPMDASARHKM